jgi:hypothetical protein
MSKMVPTIGAVIEDTDFVIARYAFHASLQPGLRRATPRNLTCAHRRGWGQEAEKRKVLASFADGRGTYPRTDP